MKKIIVLLMISMIPTFIFGDNYSSLWKKVTRAEEKDLPREECKWLQKIVEKAEKNKDYGHLLRAQLMYADINGNISPDSLKPEVERIIERSKTTEDVVLKTVYETIIYAISNRYQSWELNASKPKLTDQLCQILAKVKQDEYEPLIIKERDSEVFSFDLLSVIGKQLDMLDTVYDFYVKSGNRRAACITASSAFPFADIADIDSLLNLYQDLPEAGELAILRYKRMWNNSAKEKVEYIHQALTKWGAWKRMNYLRNEEKQLINPEYQLEFEHKVSMSGQTCKVQLKSLRNLSSLSLKIYQLDADGDILLSPTLRSDYLKLKEKFKGIVHEQTISFETRAPYEYFEDSLTIPELPVGVYLLEFNASADIQPTRCMYFVTDLFVMSENQPKQGENRLVVVNARTGEPIPGAHLRIKDYQTYALYKTYEATTDSCGEYIFQSSFKNCYRRLIFAYTDKDRSCPEITHDGSYAFDTDNDYVTAIEIYTDRSIYRPGQTVHASILAYQVENGFQQSVLKQKQMNVVLRDANYQQIAEQKVTTDDYGVATIDFNLPSSGLTGRFCIESERSIHYFNVEEYKRPTFYVEIPEIKTAYAPGDTLQVVGHALSYAGVPIQEGKVKYRIVRRMAFWWWSYSRYWNFSTFTFGNQGDEISDGETITDSQGRFKIEMPLILPETENPQFYHFVVTADVTDVAGETRTTQYSLPLGSRKTALVVDIKDKILIDDKPKATIHLLNSSGKDIQTTARYKIDGGSWQKAFTNKPFELISQKFNTGEHKMTIICEEDTLEQKFVLFTLDDEIPVIKTDDWFYLSSDSFPNDGAPVTIQVGTSAPDVHIVYSIFADDKLIERGAVNKNNQLLNLKYRYKDDYGNGLLLTFAWVKDRKCYTHQAMIQRPLPDKHLSLQWETFRDLLRPGQQETWTLKVKDAKGQPADAQLMATLYDKSLDQIVNHLWYLQPYLNLSLPSTCWQFPVYRKETASGYYRWNRLDYPEHLEFSFIENPLVSSRYSTRGFASSDGIVYKSREPMMMGSSSAEVTELKASAKQFISNDMEDMPTILEEKEAEQPLQMEMRENLNETAFFYPQLTTDTSGKVVLKFTLPESLTTWHLLALAHTKDMCYGSIEATAVAQKEVMIQPNMPRFIREDDQATIAARVSNISERNISAKVQLRLLDAETEAIVGQWNKALLLKAGETTATSFTIDATDTDIKSHSMLICQMMVAGKDFSDGEQHYLPVLPISERVTRTLSVTQHHPGTTSIDITQLIPEDVSQSSLTVEYTDQPAWLMLQTLSSLGVPNSDNAISLAAAYYANSLGRHILSLQPESKKAFNLWKQETVQVSLVSNLSQNEELKDIILNETPWVTDAIDETSQKQRLADFFDDNQMDNRLSQITDKLCKLQLSDGAWTWWPDMPGSFYMTVAVSEMLVRLNDMTDTQNQTTKTMLDGAFRFMGSEIVKEVKEMKKQEKEGYTVSFPSFKALQWLYLVTIDGRPLSDDVENANHYLRNLLKKEIHSQSILEKALTAIILSDKDSKRASEYVQSLKDYTVFNEENGRYYDTPRAGYSWFDYKIPTQCMAIEAINRITPEDRQSIIEMQRWILQQKRTQAWDTPLNSVDAVYAFLLGDNAPLAAHSNNSQFKVDGKELEIPSSTAAIGYVKTSMPSKSKTLTIDKTSEGTSWGAVYAQYLQSAKEITDFGNGFSVKREILTADGKQSKEYHVGDRIKVRITIEADRNYDFVQLIDKRSAAMEPVRQISGYWQGAYCTPRDCSTNYYFDMLSKGHHVIETEYLLDREGTYTTGTCTVQCAYSPDFRATTKSQTMIIK